MANEEGFNISKLLELVKVYWKEVWKRKWWVVIIGILVSALMLTQAWLTPKKYAAPLTFTINDESGGVSGVGAILGELGFKGGGGGKHNYEKIVELSTSRLILGQCLKTKVDVNGKRDFLGNFLLDSLKPEIKINSKNVSNFRFTEKSSTEDIESQVIANLAKLLKGDQQKGKEGILSVEFDDETTFMNITAKTEFPSLSTTIANTEYDVLSQFYIQNTIGKHKATYDHVKKKTDSIYAELRSRESSLARRNDQSHNIILNVDQLPKQQLTRKIEMLYIMYGEAVKNQEKAEFLLKSATPYFQVIDRPVGPYQPIGKSRAKALVMGGVIGGLLALGGIIGRFWFLEKLEKEKQLNG
ncbi:MAG: hypothetical protein H6607_09845 [Flavobacteriales bacterium]|nr:hypothetical protein [Flavobacteriales bacterium]